MATLPDHPSHITDPALASREDVTAWFDALLDGGYNFHPDDSFLDMVEVGTGAATFTPQQARRMDEAMRRVSALGIDPYGLALKRALKLGSERRGRHAKS